MPGYPLVVDDPREYPPGFDGRVFVWDLDKTYLATGFSSLPGLARIPIELAVDKRAIPGMAPLLRGLRRGPGPGFACAPLYFVSASPPQLKGVVARKMQLDGVEADGLIFKDWVGALRGLRPGRLREQVGFKVCALLTGRLRRPLSREVLFGDDVEADALAYSLYAALLAAPDDRGAADRALAAAGVRVDDRRAAVELLQRLQPPLGRVERVFIHLERRSPPEAFAALAPLVVPVEGAAQLGPLLFHLGLIDAGAARAALDEVRVALGDAEVRARLARLVGRGLVPGALVTALT